MSEPPRDPLSAILGEAVRHLNGGDWPLAHGCLARALQVEPAHPVALYLAGVCELRQGHWPEAERLLRRAHTDAAPAQVSMDLASALQAQGRAAEALELLGQALRQAPRDLALRLALARAREDAGLLEDAASDYRAALADHPDCAEARLRLATLLIRAARAAEAQRLLEDAPRERLSSAEQAAWSHRMGLALKHQRRHLEALPHLQDARRAAPGDRQRAIDLAVLLQHLRRYDDAAAVLREHLERAPLDLQAHLQLNELLHRQGRDDAFLASYERAAALTPQAAPLLSAKGRMLLKTGRAVEALASFERSLALAPSDPGALSGRGRALEVLGDLRGAERAHDLATRVRPLHPDAHIDAAAFMLRRLQPERARQLLSQALAARPADQAALSLLVLAHRALGEEREESWLAGYEALIGIHDLPPPAGHATMADFNRALAAYLEPLHDDKREHFTQTLRGGTRLHDEVFGNGHELIERLRVRIDEAVAQYIAHLPPDERHPFTRRRSAGFVYVSSWSSRLRDRGRHLNHVHAQGWISSAYYVAVPEVCADTRQRQGWLQFGEPTADFGDRFPPRRLVQPRPGRLLLFPSYLWHGTLPFESAQARTTIAFDVAPLGKPLS